MNTIKKVITLLIIIFFGISCNKDAFFELKIHNDLWAQALQLNITTGNSVKQRQFMKWKVHLKDFIK